MTSKITLCVDRDGLTGSLQLSINLTRADGGGHGYRISGPKFSGASKKVLHHQITQRDVAEITDYLKAVAETRRNAPDDTGLLSGVTSEQKDSTP